MSSNYREDVEKVVDEDQINSFIDTYVQAIRDQSAAVFVGAGLSIPTGMVSWKDLLRDIATDIGLDIEKESDLITVAQFHVNEIRGRHRINQALINEFSDRARSTENHAILASLPIKTYWTTNYDTLLEDALKSAKKRPDVKITVENLALTLPRRDVVVYKMHGDVSQPDRTVVTKDDYETYNIYRQLFSTALQGDLVSKTFLFLGFSFNDPNLAYILSRIRILLGENRREHFFLLRKVQRKDFTKAKDFHYAQAKQNLQISDLRRYGITGLCVDDYNQYTDILQRISQKYNMTRVFISGSSATYDPWCAEDAQKMIQGLARQLVEEGYVVVSGFGVGVGPYVVNGVLEGLKRQGTYNIDDRVILRPFPYRIADSNERKRKWTAYREDILSNAGIAIFMFGNKRTSSGELVLSEGVKEEFEIAVRKGIAVIPIGCTGSMTRDLYNCVINDVTSYYPNRRGYKRLLNGLTRMESPDEVIARVIELVNKLQRDV